MAAIKSKHWHACTHLTEGVGGVGGQRGGIGQGIAIDSVGFGRGHAIILMMISPGGMQLRLSFLRAIISQEVQHKVVQKG